MKVLFYIFLIILFSSSIRAEIKVGIMLGFTGPIESLTPAMRDGARMAFDEASNSGKLIGRERFKIIEGDSTCVDAAAATAAAESLVAKGVVAIMGADCSGVTAAINANIAVPNNITMISPSATSPALSNIPDNGTFWRTAPSDSLSAKLLAQQTIKRGINSISITYINNDYGKGVAFTFRDEFKRLGGKVNKIIKHEDNVNQNKTIKSLGKKGDALLVIGYIDGGGREIIKKSLKQKTFDTFILSDGMIGQSLVDYVGKGLNGSFGLLPRGHRFESTISLDFTAPYVTESYDADALLALAIQQTIFENKIKKNYNLIKKNLAANITKISNSPGTIIMPGDLGYGLELISQGKKINYQGFTDVEFNSFGDTYGSFTEMIVSNNSFKENKILAKGFSLSDQVEVVELNNNETLNQLVLESDSNETTNQTIEVQNDILPPEIIVNDTFIANQEMIALIQGQIIDSNKIVELTIDNEFVALKDGYFKMNLYVMPEGQQVKIQAIDKFGNKSNTFVNLKRASDIATQQNYPSLNPTLINVKDNENSVALIFGIENYAETFPALFAKNDALYFSDFVQNAFGVPKNNIKMLTNDKAGRTSLLKAITKWLPKNVEENQTNIYLFYSGHGLASEDGEDLYLLPSDGDPEMLEESTLLRSWIFREISELNPKSVIVFLDTCYSGATRSEELLVASKPIFIDVAEQAIPDNFTVFSASSGRQTAKVLPEAEHGLFSYFLMKGMEGLADTNKNNEITSQELYDYLNSKVSKIARQNPQLEGDYSQILIKW